MRRNVRNITLMGIAALVLGGVAVAASGTFDSPPTDAVASDGFAATDRSTSTTIAAFRTHAKLDSRARCRGWCGRDSRRSHRRRHWSATTATQAPTTPTDGAEDREDRGPDGLDRQGQVRRSVRRGIAHRDRERWVRRQLVDVDERASRATRSRSTTRAPATPVSDNRAQAGQLTIRVPAEKFDATRAALSGLGDVENESINGQDVCSQLVDLGARITSLKAEEAAFQTLLGKATAIGDVLQIQDQLFNVRTQIEQLAGAAGEPRRPGDVLDDHRLDVRARRGVHAAARVRALDPRQGVGRRDGRRAQRARRHGRDPRLRSAARVARPRSGWACGASPVRGVVAAGQPSSSSRWRRSHSSMWRASSARPCSRTS